MSEFFKRLLFLSLLLSAPAATFADIGADRDWVKPGVNVERGSLYLKLDRSVTPLKVTMHDGSPLTGVPSIDAVSGMFGVTSIEQSLTGETPPKNPGAIDLSCYYTVHFPEELDPTVVGESFEECKEVIFAEHVRITYKYYTPNDPRLGSEWHIAYCGFPEAWDYTRGSRDVVIGIVDSGMDMPIDEFGDPQIHEDMVGNIWVNPGEDIDHNGTIDLDDWNGEDDDENGFADDFHGWDLTGRDNWPDDIHGATPGASGHGTHVAGCASAATDNEIGVAGAAFSASIMVAACYHPTNDLLIANGYQGINYCTRAGARIINLSWGSRSGPSNFERDVINSALNQGVIIFGAAGNDSLEDRAQDRLHHYPSSYNGVIGVAASDNHDNKTDFSVYGDFIDLVAPGENILSLVPHNRYTFYPGTSMSSPIAAGLGALMLSIEPALTSEDLLEWMQRTAVDISEQNARYNGIRYRINADFLINSTHPKYDVTEWALRERGGDGDEFLEQNERWSVDFAVTNVEGYQNAFDARVTISTLDTTIRLEDDLVNIGDLMAGESFFSEVNDALGFNFRHGTRPHYSTIVLTFIDDGGYRFNYPINFTAGHPNYLLVDDDGEDTFERFYEQDLDVRPVVHNTWTTATDGLPSLEWLRGFDNILWICGNARNGLSEAEQSLLAGWLDSEKHQGLLISGQYLADDIGGTAFHQNYLHSRLVNASNGGRQLTGAADNPISRDVSLLLIGGAGAGNNQSPSSLEPVNGGDTLFTYNNVGGVGAVFYGSEAYSVVYTGFSLEAASGMGQTTLRSDFIHRIFDRFYVLDAPREESPQPDRFALSTPYPNPFNGETRIGVTAPGNAPYRLEVTDLSGRVVATLADSRTRQSGSFVWNAAAAPAGLYLFRLSWDGGTLTQKAALVR